MGTQLFPSRKLPAPQRNRGGKRVRILKWLAVALIVYTTANAFLRETEIDLNAHPGIGNAIVEPNVPGTDPKAVPSEVERLPTQKVWVGEHLSPAEMAEQEGIAAQAENTEHPVVTSVHPPHGPRVGGTVVLIRGRNFGKVGTLLTATIGGQPCDATKWLSPEALHCLVP
eukprot:CAMPEP_0118949140 /NCGR_PEP_ID=MMETSP1169-20130426/49109_1 /TAXON_ID=36882 /ORGANISM="Pyramimonas obovata, Strain CCMP722" /LENGTH=169 /DNA_ID=CAMNT_0006895703 /DNA_START=263 /DNA_END=768 /DNA_ORIENTATION=-